MEYSVKAVIIGRKKKEKDDDEDVRPCFISLFDMNNPHTSGKVPKEILDFKVHKVIIKGLDINYLLPGNDLVVNDLTSIDVEQDGEHLIVTGKQEK